MPRYLIERNIPGASKLSQQELQGISQKSCGVLSKMGPPDTVGSELRCRRQDLLRLHRSDEKMVREHAQLGGFPANLVTEVKTIIDPTTGGA